jgi:hypothetical protein
MYTPAHRQPSTAFPVTHQPPGGPPHGRKWRDALKKSGWYNTPSYSTGIGVLSVVASSSVDPESTVEPVFAAALSLEDVPVPASGPASARCPQAHKTNPHAHRTRPSYRSADARAMASGSLGLLGRSCVEIVQLLVHNGLCGPKPMVVCFVDGVRVDPSHLGTNDDQSHNRDRRSLRGLIGRKFVPHALGDAESPFRHRPLGDGR